MAAKFKVGQRVSINTYGVVELVRREKSWITGKVLPDVWVWRIKGKAVGTCPEYLMRPLTRRRKAVSRG